MYALQGEQPQNAAHHLARVLPAAVRERSWATAWLLDVLALLHFMSTPAPASLNSEFLNRSRFWSDSELAGLHDPPFRLVLRVDVKMRQDVEVAYLRVPSRGSDPLGFRAVWPSALGRARIIGQALLKLTSTSPKIWVNVMNEAIVRILNMEPT